MLQSFLHSIRDRRYVTLDTETTGLGNAEIVDIAVVDAYGNTIYETFVKPTISIPVESSNIHGITDDMVSNAPSWDSVVPNIREAISGKVLVIYNRAYDVKILNYVSGLCGVDWNTADSIECAMLAYSQFANDCGLTEKKKWHKLTDAIKASNLVEEHAHRAKGDAIMTTRICEYMLAKTKRTLHFSFGKKVLTTS